MPIETETFPCGHCRKPVETQWAVRSSRNGLLRGPYVILGDVVFHEPVCVDAYLKEFTEACNNDHSQQ